MKKKSSAINYIDQLLNESKSSKFQVPPKLVKYYKMDDNIRNAKNWQGKIITLNSGSEASNKIGDFDQIRYIGIDLNSNMIVPITTCDEHQTGYELLGVLIRKKLIPDSDWTTIDSWGTNFIYNNAEHTANMLKAFKKFLEYGGDPKLKVEGMGGGYLGNIEDFISRNGNIKIGKNELAFTGKEIVEKLEHIAKEYTRLDGISKKFRTPKESDIVNLGEYCIALLTYFDDLLFTLKIRQKKYEKYITEDKINKWISEIKKAISDLNYVDIVLPILSANGFKNNLHQCLKMASKETDSYYKEGFETVFGDINTAIKEFDRVAQI